MSKTCLPSQPPAHFAPLEVDLGAPPAAPAPAGALPGAAPAVARGAGDRWRPPAGPLGAWHAKEHPEPHGTTWDNLGQLFISVFEVFLEPCGNHTNLVEFWSECEALFPWIIHLQSSGPLDFSTQPRKAGQFFRHPTLVFPTLKPAAADRKPSFGRNHSIPPWHHGPEVPSLNCSWLHTSNAVGRPGRPLVFTDLCALEMNQIETSTPWSSWIELAST